MSWGASISGGFGIGSHKPGARVEKLGIAVLMPPCAKYELPKGLWPTVQLVVRAVSCSGAKSK